VTKSIPYEQIETLFLDAGNTLISMDFDWIAAEIQTRGISCDPCMVRRAEAAARPTVSHIFTGKGYNEGLDRFRIYLSKVLSRLEPVARKGPQAVESLADELVPVLWKPGEANRLWRWILPGVPDALDAFRSMGLQLVVVSNSDGTAERSLIDLGLRRYLTAVVDSDVVGFAKPDPRIFQYALAACGTHPERVLHVGDMLHADIEGARRAGLHALLLDPFDDWIEVDCERVPDLGALVDRFRASRNAHTV
jgi:putative hydrolase of the HAD superfamily